jgi:hypothetical protein
MCSRSGLTGAFPLPRGEGWGEGVIVIAAFALNRTGSGKM